MKRTKPSAQPSRKTRRRSKRALKSSALQLVNPHAAGVDIGSTEHYVGVSPDADPKPVRSFGTTTPDLQQLIQWLQECKVTTVAMESTGVYWIPLYEMLEAAGIEAVLVDSHQVRNVPGRKTDVQDCQWIQTLHSYGLFRGAFRPSDEICPLRAYMRQAKNLIEESSSKILQMQKALTQMNVLVHQAVTDITGVTGMAIIRAIVAGQRNPEALAELRDPRCRKTKKQIAQALTGNFRPEHLFVLTQALEAYDFLQQQLVSCEEQIQQTLQALRPPTQGCPPALSDRAKALRLQRQGEEPMRQTLFDFFGVDLVSIPGINVQTVMTLLAEVGVDLKAFPSEGHWASWLDACPRRAITGGKVRKKVRRQATNRLFAALRMAATSLKNADNYLGAYFRRKQARFGTAVAIKATAHKLARIIYHMITHRASYQELGSTYHQQRYRDQELTRLRRRAKQLGYHLVLTPQNPCDSTSLTS